MVSASGRGESVRCSTLDAELACVDTLPISVLKLDVEGHEIRVLNGAAQTLKRTSCILMEACSAYQDRCKATAPELIERLRSVGFSPYGISSAGEIWPWTLEHPSETLNVWFVQNTALKSADEGVLP